MVLASICEMHCVLFCEHELSSDQVCLAVRAGPGSRENFRKYNWQETVEQL